MKCCHTVKRPDLTCVVTLVKGTRSALAELIKDGVLSETAPCGPDDAPKKPESLNNGKLLLTAPGNKSLICLEPGVPDE